MKPYSRLNQGHSIEVAPCAGAWIETVLRS